MTTIMQEDETYEMRMKGKKKYFKCKTYGRYENVIESSLLLLNSPQSFCVIYRHSSLESLVDV